MLGGAGGSSAVGGDVNIQAGAAGSSSTPGAVSIKDGGGTTRLAVTSTGLVQATPGDSNGLQLHTITKITTNTGTLSIVPAGDSIELGDDSDFTISRGTQASSTNGGQTKLTGQTGKTSSTAGGGARTDTAESSSSGSKLPRSR